MQIETYFYQYNFYKATTVTLQRKHMHHEWYWIGTNEFLRVWMVDKKKFVTILHQLHKLL